MIENLSGHEAPLEVKGADPGLNARNASRELSHTSPADSVFSLGSDQIHVSRTSTPSAPGDTDGGGLADGDQHRDPNAGLRTPDEQRELRELRETDRQVRRQQRIHATMAGSTAPTGAEYEFSVGPDGRRYAVSGDVRIQLSSGDNPEESIRLAKEAYRAATVPRTPDARDRSIAAEAARQIFVNQHRLDSSASPEYASPSLDEAASGNATDITSTNAVPATDSDSRSPTLLESTSPTDLRSGTGDNGSFVTNGTDTSTPVVDDLRRAADERTGRGQTAAAHSIADEAIAKFGKATGNAVARADEVASAARSGSDGPLATPTGQAEPTAVDSDTASPMERAIEAYGNAAIEIADAHEMDGTELML